MYDGRKIGYLGSGGSDAVGEIDRPISPVERELNILGETVSSLLSSCEELQNRLGGVLRNDPTKEAGTGTPEESLSEIPSRIRSYRYTISETAKILRGITNRLEL
jgi:hypothetical protein